MISQVYVDAQVDAAYDALLEAAGETQVGKTPQPNHMDFEGYTDKDGSQITQKRTFEAVSYTHLDVYKRQDWDWVRWRLQGGTAPGDCPAIPSFAAAAFWIPPLILPLLWNSLS